MNENFKKELLRHAKEHVEQVSSNITEHITYIESSIQNLRNKLKKGGLEDPEVLVEVIIHQIETKQQLDYSYSSPYFIRCDVKFDDASEDSILYFGRFAFTRDFIFSWVAPVASIRFESPGRFSYTLPNGDQRGGVLLRKDQFMIVDQHILFMSTEAVNYPRNLVYQKYFSKPKTEFVLPEIVEQMEKAQDKIIRSHHKGSFLISGAAGSGKTTLALHRVAYLVQSPETNSWFEQNHIIVFVQDNATKQYFQGLLPELGIYRVKITTFDQWAMRILAIDNIIFAMRYGVEENEKDEYEYSKNKALQFFKEAKNNKDIFTVLENAYKNFFTNPQKKLFEKQIKDKVLDRFDLTLLLKNSFLKNNALIETVEKYVKQKSTGRYVKKTIRRSVGYSLIVLDEAENYLMEQISLVKTCIDPITNAVIYVGDLIQQTLLWTIKDWGAVNELFEADRQVILQKVYRNTKQILEYIKSVGYDIEIPEKIKDGKAVTEKICADKSDEIDFIREIVSENTDKTIGILAKTEEYLSDYKKVFRQNKKLHILTINQAQGVEFDTVILVGTNKELYETNDRAMTEITKERKRVNHDLIYVALTRAINELYVLGNTTIKKLV